MPKVMVDAAYPPHPWPTTAPTGEPVVAVLVYAGGDTPNPVTDPAVVAALPYRYRLPTWVRSNPTQASAVADAAAFAGWLQKMGCPVGSAVCLDLETAVDPAWVTTFTSFIENMGWKVMDYGSRSTLYQNPAGKAGDFDAHPGDAPGTIDPGNTATQDVYAGAYDLSWVEDSVPLWDTQGPAPSPQPVPTTTGEPMWPVKFQAPDGRDFGSDGRVLYHLSPPQAALFDIAGFPTKSISAAEVAAFPVVEP